MNYRFYIEINCIYRSFNYTAWLRTEHKCDTNILKYNWYFHEMRISSIYSRCLRVCSGLPGFPIVGVSFTINGRARCSLDHLKVYALTSMNCYRDGWHIIISWRETLVAVILDWAIYIYIFIFVLSKIKTTNGYTSQYLFGSSCLQRCKNSND